MASDKKPVLDDIGSLPVFRVDGDGYVRLPIDREQQLDRIEDMLKSLMISTSAADLVSLEDKWKERQRG